MQRRAAPFRAAPIRATTRVRLAAASTPACARALTLTPLTLQRFARRGLRGFSAAGPAAQSGNVRDFILADIGEGIAEVEVLEWIVEPGAKVQEYDELLRVQSDKAATEITSPYEGTVLELMVNAGDLAQVGQPLCRIQVDGDAGDDGAASAAVDSKPSGEPVAAQQDSGSADLVESQFRSGKVLTSPAVRRLARENGIDLSKVAATGPKGRVLKSDVLAFLNGSPTPASTQRAETAAAPAAAKTPAPAAEDTVVPVRGIERIMVQTMNKAAQVPTLLFSDEYEMNRLIQTRSGLKPVAAELGVKLTYLPFIIKAASLALLEYPKLNCHVNDEACTEYTLKASHNIGVAVQTAQGLLVPNVKNVQDKSVLDVARDLADLQALGHEGKLTTENLTGGTFTISNIGAVGGIMGMPLLVVPEVAIAALGKFQEVPRFDEADDIYKASLMNVSITADHRIIDGATVARFSNLWRDYLENPDKMLLNTR